MSVTRYARLTAWKRSIDFVVAIYRLSRHLPADEEPGLIATLRRTATAIPAKIADGHGRPDPAAFEMALIDAEAMLRELSTHVQVAERLRYVTRLRTSGVHRRVQRVVKIIRKQRQSLCPTG